MYLSLRQGGLSAITGWLIIDRVLFRHTMPLINIFDLLSVLLFGLTRRRLQVDVLIVKRETLLHKLLRRLDVLPLQLTKLSHFL